MDIIQDRFVVHGDHYRAVREGLAKTVISGNIQDIVTAITVSVPCIFFFAIVPFIFFTNEKVRVKAVDYCGLFWIVSTPDIQK